jgi:hypothetical protein
LANLSQSVSKQVPIFRFESEDRYTHNTKIPHNSLRRPQHSAHILRLLHKPNPLTPRRMRHEIPREEANPIGNVTRLARVGAVHEARLQLGAQFAQVVVHEALKVEGALVVVEFLDRAEVRGVPGVTAGTEHVGDQGFVLEGVIDTKSISE